MKKPAIVKAAIKTNPAKAAPTANRTRSTDRSTPTGQSSPASKSNVAKRPSTQDQLAALLLRDEGASLDQMVVATGWLQHTTRAALTGLKKKGYVISSDKIDGLRTYRAAAPQ